MPTIRLRHFSKPTVLRSIEPKRLHSLLEPYKSFFEQRGLKLSTPSSAAEICYDSLVNILSNPNQETPPDLVDALCLIDEMSTPQAIDQLLGCMSLAELGMFADDKHSPADIAVGAWLLRREAVEEIHAKQWIVRPKSFEYFSSQCSSSSRNRQSVFTASTATLRPTPTPTS